MGNNTRCTCDRRPVLRGRRDTVCRASAESWAILQVFLAFFCVTWIVGYGLHLLLSPDGALVHEYGVILWRTVQREQEDRHRRYWTQYRDSRRDSGRQ
jgi:hypothetical protein